MPLYRATLVIFTLPGPTLLGPRRGFPNSVYGVVGLKTPDNVVAHIIGMIVRIISVTDNGVKLIQSATAYNERCSAYLDTDVLRRY
jgi:hypothetical protein